VVLAVIGLVVLFYVLQKKKRRGKLLTSSSQGFELNPSMQDAIYRASFSKSPVADSTLTNTTMEISFPAFLCIDFTNQLRKEGAIGSGGFASIYKGIIIDEQLRKKTGLTEVAIKEVIFESDLTPEENEVKFHQEIAMMWRLHSCPNAINLVGYCNQPRCIVTQLYRTDLFKYVHNKGLNLPPEMALHFASDIALGMKAIHAAGLVHRDLKSPNILLENLVSYGGKATIRAVICDFGIARVVNAIVLDQQKFLNIQGLSPRYTAPEVFARIRNQAFLNSEEEFRSDVYSYGSILWEIVSRRKPWEDCQSFQEIDKRVSQGLREALPAANGNWIFELLNGLITACWAQNPFDRPTFNGIVQKLEATSIY